MKKEQQTSEYLIEAPSRFSLNLKELWEYRELFYFFTWRDIKVRYKQTMLGFLWAVLQPFMMMVIMTVVFGHALQVDSEGIPYPIFVFSGLLFWDIFASGLSGSANSMVTNAQIIKKIYFPRLIVPLSAVLVAFFDFLMALIVFVGLLIYFQQAVNIPRLLLFFPLALLLTITTTFGLGCMLAAFNVKYRDFRYVVPYMIRFLLFVNPVMYSTSIFKAEWAQYLIAANPLAGAINMGRYAFTDVPIDWNLLGISWLSALILLVLGIYIFRKTEAYFADLA